LKERQVPGQSGDFYRMRFTLRHGDLHWTMKCAAILTHLRNL
jgi:hypothetical protein